MDFDISERLKTVASQVKYRKIADIGTDHAYVPIYLSLNNIIDYCIACDINKGPIEKANVNIKKYNLENKIFTKIGNGLNDIDKYNIETVIIAGMGGNLIIDILNNNINTVKNLKQLIFQPQLDTCKLRKYIHSIGLIIENEKIVYDDKKYYNIISCAIGNEIYYKDEHYMFGKKLIDKKDTILKQYINSEIKKYNNILNNLNGKNTISCYKRIKDISNKLKILKEVLNCL